MSDDAIKRAAKKTLLSRTHQLHGNDRSEAAADRVDLEVELVEAVALHQRDVLLSVLPASDRQRTAEKIVEDSSKNEFGQIFKRIDLDCAWRTTPHKRRKWHSAR